jgi:membrane associated rhomboid family serine protease
MTFIRESLPRLEAPMVVVYVLVGIIGMVISAPILWWRCGPHVAFLGSLFGASLSVLTLVLLLALRSNNRSHDER